MNNPIIPAPAPAPDPYPDFGSSEGGGGELTGLPFPKTWTGAYKFVLATFALWIVLLIALTECCK
ncbi:MAG TPA: hypothetical protein V6C72_16560 [Chroococcales cyanobacterium]